MEGSYNDHRYNDCLSNDVTMSNGVMAYLWKPDLKVLSNVLEGVILCSIFFTQYQSKSFIAWVLASGSYKKQLSDEI